MSYVRLNRRATLGLLAAMALAPVHAAGQPGVAAPVVKVPKPAPMDLCPVCGMVVSKYPNWVATVLWKNGQTHHFDGAKDMFKFLHNLAKYAPRQQAQDIVTIAVTEYYNLDKVDARKAWYVIGSDVLGPMGHEFVPLATRADADDFFKEHRGKGLFNFEQITAEMPGKLDNGRFT